MKREVTEVITPKPTIKEIKESEIEILDKLNQKQIVLFIDKEYGELLDMGIKDKYTFEEYDKKREKFSQYWKFFTSQDVYKSQAFYRGFGMAYNRKFYELNAFKMLEEWIAFIMKLNHFIIEFCYTTKLLIKVLGVVFENIDSDTDLKDNGLLDGYNDIIEELYATSFIYKMDIDSLLPVFEVSDVDDFALSPGIVKELKLEDYAEKFEQFKKMYLHFEKVKKECDEIAFPLFEVISEDGFASFKMEMESDNPKQKLVYDMNKFRVKLEK